MLVQHFFGILEAVFTGLLPPMRGGKTWRSMLSHILDCPSAPLGRQACRRGPRAASPRPGPRAASPRPAPRAASPRPKSPILPPPVSTSLCGTCAPHMCQLWRFTIPMHEVLHIWYLSGDKNDAHNLIEIHPRDHAFPACAPRMASGFVRCVLTLRRLQQIVFHCEFGRRHKTPIEIPQDSLFIFSPSRKS